MNRIVSSALALATAIAGLSMLRPAYAQTPETTPAEPPGSAAVARPAHSPDAAAGENGAAAGKANPADAQSPPLADPLKQEAVQDPPQAVLAPATRFTTTALLEGMTEVRLARLARFHTGNAEVRRLAAQLVSDHQQSDTSLGAIAARRSITAPQELDPGRRTLVKNLEAQRGAAFDRAFLSLMVASHERTIALFTAAAAGDDAELAAFATRALPRLKAREDRARSLQASAASLKTT